MSEIDASNYAALHAALEGRSNEEVLATIQAQEGGVDTVLDQVFEGMCQSFVPSRAAGQQVSVQYDLTVPDGTRSYAMHIADGACTAERGTAESPRVSLRVSMVDFLRLITGTANGVQLFMTGKLKVSGDLFFGQTFQTWFDRPSASS